MENATPMGQVVEGQEEMPDLEKQEEMPSLEGQEELTGAGEEGEGDSSHSRAEKKKLEKHFQN